MDESVGLTSEEAARRLKAEGRNVLPRPARRTPLRIIFEVVREPMFGLLLAGGAIYLVLGSLDEALVLLAFATASVSIAVVQQVRTERVLEALRDLTSPRALVIRDHKRVRIAGSDVVRGDAVVLAEGDRVPADGVLTLANDVLTDESLLTGESVPVRKRMAASGDRQMAAPGGDDLPSVFAGTLIVRGHGIAEILATGAHSQIGKIGAALGGIELEPPRLQVQVMRLVRIFAVLGLAASVVVVLIYGLTRGDWLQALLAGIALGMSMMPEEFPLVLTVFMVMGAWRMSKSRVLTRRAAAIETLGAATVLCTDKTGTLTENRMTIAALATLQNSVRITAAKPSALPPELRDVLAWGVMASAPEPFDPMEKAFHALDGEVEAPENRAAASTLLRTYGLRPDLLAMTQVWQSAASDDVQVAAKGAVEAIIRLCKLDQATAARARALTDEMAATGMRVLAVARATLPKDAALPADQSAFDFALVGLVGLTDPLRAAVPQAVQECKSAGIRVIMITGDYPGTAAAIAKEAGIDAATILTGEELDRLSDGELANALRSVGVCARITPQQKLRLVNALKANGEVVAMTGDGVNDAPSLKAAHIGIAMGGRGTDVAREASSIVLLDDDFNSIVRTIRLGRRIYDNLRKAIGYIMAIHVPIAGLALLPLLLGFPILFFPIHIAFLEMVIDPVCSIVFEAEDEESNVMARPPRPPAQPLFTTATIGWSVFQGIAALLTVLGIYASALFVEMPEAEARALTYASLIFVNVGLILANRSFGVTLSGVFGRANRTLWLVLATVMASVLLILAWAPARELFHFGPLNAAHIGIALAAGAAILVLLNSAKLLQRKAF